MNKESIIARLNDLETQLQQAINTANALTCAVQDCKYWLEVVETEELKKAGE